MSPAEIVRAQRAFFQTGATRPPDSRRAPLETLSECLDAHEAALLAALQKDLGKSRFQGWASEFALVKEEIRFALKHLARWSSPRRVNTPWLLTPARGWVQAEPFGVALILAPWNYPVQLTLAPLVSALAAGNTAVLKPSELAPRTADALADMLGGAFKCHQVAVVTGGPDVAEALLREKFDKIFFTGGTRVGRKVAAAAARDLTPVTLELGGKCPAIVCADAKVELAAKRIAWGKFLNAGQTCVAPDYVLVQRPVLDKFLAALKQSVRDFYGEDAGQCGDYGRIVNATHFGRLANYLRDGQIAFGGQTDAGTLFFAPTVLTGVALDSPVMEEEIFGPILPLHPFDTLDDALKIVNARPAPLALYVFTEDRPTEARVLRETRSGGACVNDTVSHMLSSTMPFGGLGESGQGAYHGRAGFEAFSHQRAILGRGTWLDLPFRYPPQKLSLDALKRAMKFLLRG